MLEASLLSSNERAAALASQLSQCKEQIFKLEEGNLILERRKMTAERNAEKQKLLVDSVRLKALYYCYRMMLRF